MELVNNDTELCGRSNNASNRDLIQSSKLVEVRVPRRLQEAELEAKKGGAVYVRVTHVLKKSAFVCYIFRPETATYGVIVIELLDQLLFYSDTYL